MLEEKIISDSNLNKLNLINPSFVLNDTNQINLNSHEFHQLIPINQNNQAQHYIHSSQPNVAMFNNHTLNSLNDSSNSSMGTTPILVTKQNGNFVFNTGVHDPAIPSIYITPTTHANSNVKKFNNYVD
jgi:hypothetical protein